MLTWSESNTRCSSWMSSGRVATTGAFLIGFSIPVNVFVRFLSSDSCLDICLALVSSFTDNDILQLVHSWLTKTGTVIVSICGHLHQVEWNGVCWVETTTPELAIIKCVQSGASYKMIKPIPWLCTQGPRGYRQRFLQAIFTDSCDLFGAGYLQSETGINPIHIIWHKCHVFHVACTHEGGWEDAPNVTLVANW